MDVSFFFPFWRLAPISQLHRLPIQKKKKNQQQRMDKSLLSNSATSASPDMPFPNCFGPKTLPYLLKAACVLGCVGSGFYTTYKLIWEFSNLRWTIVFGYCTVFAVLLLSAELNLLAHRHFKRFGRFMTTFVGRAFFYIFIGGLLLEGIEGWCVGIYLMTLGVINIGAQCACTGQEESKPDAIQPAAI